MLLLSVFNFDFHAYEAYDKGRLPFGINFLILTVRETRASLTLKKLK